MKRMLFAMMLAFMVLSQPARAEMSGDTKRAQIHTQLGSGYLGLGKFGIALEELDKALKADSSYAPTYNILGLVYMELREFDKADENFRHSLRLDPNDSETHNNYGWFLCQRGHPDEAIEHFTTALKNPLYATPEIAYLNSGLCTLKKGDDKAAEDYFLRALKFQSAPPQAMFQLAEIYLRRGSFIDAEYYLEHYLMAVPTNSQGLWLGIRIAHRFGKRDMEASYGLELRKKFPDSRENLAYRNGEFDNPLTAGGR